MKKINIAIIGAGYWGPNLIRNFHRLQESSVVAVCDLSPKRLAHIKGVYPDIRSETDLNKILEDPNIHAVAVATPVSTHFKIGSLCLAAGKHTLIEKPLANSARECQELNRIAESNKLVLMTGHTFIFSPAVRKIKEIKDKGDLGDLWHMSSRRLNLGLFQKDINVIWDLAPHDISIFNYLLGGAPRSVRAWGTSHVGNGVEDVASLCLEYSPGLQAHCQMSWVEPKKIRQMTFVGSNKMLFYDDLESEYKIHLYDKHVDVPPYYDTFAEFQFSYHYGERTSPKLEMWEPLHEECSHFISCIQGRVECLASGRHGLEVVKVLEAADQSLKTSGGIAPLS